MSVLQRFTSLDALKGIGRDLLVRFLDPFEADLAAHHIQLPDPGLSDTAYFQQAAAILDAGALPDRLTITLAAFAEMVRDRAPKQLKIIAAHPATGPPARYSLRKGLGTWDLTFDSQQAGLKHEKGIFYVDWLLYHPSEHPLHALDLITKIPEIYRIQLGLPQIPNPATGKSTLLSSDARIQERSLALDDAETVRALLRKEKKLEAILDDETESEPVKAEVERELEQIAEFLRKHSFRSKDSAQNAADTVRTAIKRLQLHLSRAVDVSGNPHPVFRPFALHIAKYIQAPSARSLPGCFLYEPPPGVSWSN